jgi:hypothetical protein
MMKNTALNLTRRLVLPLAVFCASQGAMAAVQVVTLPDPGSLIQGIPTSFLYDQGWSYSAKLLDQMQTAGQIPTTYGDYQFSTGTGTIPVLVYTGPGGPTNPSPFEQPLDACNGGNCNGFQGTWNLGSTGSDYAGTVGALRTMLSGAGLMLYFDHNEEEGKNAIPNLRATGQLSIYNGSTRIQSWAFDSNPDGTYNSTAWVTSCSEFNVGATAPNNLPCDIYIPTATATYQMKQNSGSGKPDYFLIPDGFDLYDSMFLDSYKFVIDINLTDLNPGFDELGIAGFRFAQQVDEPTPLALMGIAFLCLAAQFRRRTPENLPK